MAGEVNFDIESFQQLSPDAQAAAKQIISGLNQISGAGIARLGDNLDQWQAMNKYTGLAGKALTGLDIAQSISEGNEQQAIEQAGEWLTGEALSNGFSKVIEETTRSNFAGRYGWNIGSQEMHKAWSDAVGGAMADAAQAGADSLEAAGEWLKDRATEVETTPPPIIIRSQVEFDYVNTLLIQRDGGVHEYGHFETLPYKFHRTDEALGRTEPRPFQSSLPRDVLDATGEAFDAVRNSEVPGHIIPSFNVPPWQRVGAVDELTDFVTATPGYKGSGPGLNEALNYDLDVGDRLNIDLRGDVANHALDYIHHAQVEDGRDLDFNAIAEDVERIADNAELFTLELRQMRTDFPSDKSREDYFSDKVYNHAFEGGRLDAGDSIGALMIGRDGGRHNGSIGDDLSLDASVAMLGAGHDIAILDNETGHLADGGAGDDILIGGERSETLIGGVGEDHMRGHAGEDTLYGTAPDMEDDGVRDYLSGGAGIDTYYVGDNDVIEATPDGDRDDVIHFNGLTLEGPVTTTSAESTGAAGEVYTLGEDGKTLTVTHGEHQIEIRDFTNGDFGIDLTQLEAATTSPALVPTKIKLEKAIEILAEDQKTLNQQAQETGVSSLAHRAVNHPDAAQMMQKLHMEGVSTFKAEVTSDMCIEARVGCILHAGKQATHEAGLLLPVEERAIDAQADEASRSHIQTAESVYEDDHSYGA